MRKIKYRVPANSISNTQAYYRGHWFSALPRCGDGTRWQHVDSGQEFYISGLDDPKGPSFVHGADKILKAWETEPAQDPLFIVRSEGGEFERSGDKTAPIRIYADGRLFDDIIAEARSRRCWHAGFNPAFWGCFSAGRLIEIAETACS